jgi:fucose permease
MNLILGVSGFLIGCDITFYLFCLIQLILGFSAGCCDVNANTLIFKVNSRDNVDKKVILLHFFFGLGASISPIFIAIMNK